MKKIYTEKSEIIIGTSKEIKRLHKNLKKKTNLTPWSDTERPFLFAYDGNKENNLFGIEIDPEYRDYYGVLNKESIESAIKGEPYVAW